jgi:hypothetical protein
MRLLFIALLATIAMAQTGPTTGRDNYRPMTAGERWGYYGRHTYASPTLAWRVGWSAAIWQWNDRPEDYGQGAAGFGRRAAERMGRIVVSDSVEAAGAAALGYDIRYVRCDCQGTGRRIRHAIVWNFLTLDAAGRTRVNVPHLAAPFASEMLSQAWLPPGTRTNAAAARGAVVQVSTGAAVNIWREFWPDIRRALRK